MLKIIYVCLIFYEMLGYFIIIHIKPDKYIYKYFISSTENDRYNNYYLSQSPPKNVYKLNFKYGNIYKCCICLDIFCNPSHGAEAILLCGHRFHCQCIRSWELIQFTLDPYINCYSCPLCKQKYNWKQKYHYIYTINHPGIHH